MSPLLFCALQRLYEAHQKLDLVRCLFSSCEPVDIESYYQFSLFNFEMEVSWQCRLKGRGGAGIFGGPGKKTKPRLNSKRHVERERERGGGALFQTDASRHLTLVTGKL